MKPSIVVLYFLVSISLVFSLATFVIVAQDHGLFAPSTPSNTPKVQVTSTPNPTQTPTELNISYTQSPKEDLNNGLSKVTYAMSVTYQKGSPITVNYSNFYLQLSAPRMGIVLPAGTVAPQNSGTLTLSSSHPTEVFELMFEFPTTSFNGMDQATTYYGLYYNGAATVNWLSNA
jgi:hypothetical protein